MRKINFISLTVVFFAVTLNDTTWAHHVHHHHGHGHFPGGYAFGFGLAHL